MQELPAYMIWFVLIVCLGISAYSWSRNRMDRSRKKKQDEEEEDAPSRNTARAHRRIADQAMTDLIGVARDAAAQIDTKIRLLNHLVKEANACIKRLRVFFLSFAFSVDIHSLSEPITS